MARRARKGVDHSVIIGIVLGVLILGAGGFVVLNRTKDPLAGVTEFNYNDFQQNANSLSGNVYRVSGTIDDKIRWTPDRGQLVVLDVEGEFGNGPLPVLIPSEFNGVNISRGDQVTMKIEIGAKGKPIVRELKKS